MQVGSLRTHLSRHPAAWASFDLHSKFPVEFSSELPSLHACVLFPVFSESNDKTLVSSESWVYTTCPPPATQVGPGPCSWGAQGAPARWPCTPPVLARAWPGPRHGEKCGLCNCLLAAQGHSGNTKAAPRELSPTSGARPALFLPSAPRPGQLVSVLPPGDSWELTRSHLICFQ